MEVHRLMISLDRFTCLLVVVLLPISLFIQYWIIRHAVRAAIHDTIGHRTHPAVLMARSPNPPGVLEQPPPGRPMPAGEQDTGS